MKILCIYGVVSIYVENRGNGRKKKNLLWEGKIFGEKSEKTNIY